MAYRATLKDVAAAAGVSVTTVSLVLNNRPARELVFRGACQVRGG